MTWSFLAAYGHMLHDSYFPRARGGHLTWSFLAAYGHMLHDVYFPRDRGGHMMWSFLPAYGHWCAGKHNCEMPTETRKTHG